MANLAVKIYEDVDVSEKPAGIPDAWPAEIVGLGESTELPESGGPWTLMTEAEYSDYIELHQAEYDAWLVTVELAAGKLVKIAALQEAANSFLDLHYPALVRQQLVNMYTLAKFDSLTNRAAYIRPGINWALGVTAYVLARAAFINSRTTIGAVEAVTWDIPTNAGTDPAITLGGAFAILD